MRFRFIPGLVMLLTLALPGSALAIPSHTIFSYTGGEQSYTVPSGVVMVVVAVKGGRGGQFAEGGGHEGGVGAEMAVTPGQQLFVEVGSAGVYDGGAVFGGGGAAGPPPPVICMLSNNGGPCAQTYASSGGGATDFRTCSITASSCPGGVSSAATRLIVGGGGGGTNGGGNGLSYPCGHSEVGVAHAPSNTRRAIRPSVPCRSSQRRGSSIPGGTPRTAGRLGHS